MTDPADLNPIPEVPTFVDVTIVGDHLVATTEEGERVAFAFELAGEDPGPVRLDADDLERVEDPHPDEWLQALITHPISAAWLDRIKADHTEAFNAWFEQRDYDEGGGEG